MKNIKPASYEMEIGQDTHQKVAQWIKGIGEVGFDKLVDELRPGVVVATMKWIEERDGDEEVIRIALEADLVGFARRCAVLGYYMGLHEAASSNGHGAGRRLMSLPLGTVRALRRVLQRD